MSEASIKERILSWLNLNKPEETNVIQEVEEKAVIPEEYKRRFNLDPVVDPSQLLGRDEIQDQIKQAYGNWKISNNPLLIVAEHGVGMSSLLNCSSQLFDELILIENIVNIGNRAKLVQTLKSNLQLDDSVSNLTQIAEAIPEESNLTIVFENVERLFLRKVNGFNVLEDFLLFIHSTKDKIFWIITINDYSYYYLNETKAFASNFLSTIKLQGLKQEIITDAITQRNSGYDVHYFRPKKFSSISSRNFKEASGETQQEILEENYYKQMLNFAKGNISIAFIYWLQSVKMIEDKTIYVRAFEPNPFSDLSLDELLTLEAIHQHSS
ncbi:MAG: hypothetical protein AAGK97_17400, partial [Bacteroidota bacterium]